VFVSRKFIRRQKTASCGRVLLVASNLTVEDTHFGPSALLLNMSGTQAAVLLTISP
jgi:hypothetical protein